MANTNAPFGARLITGFYPSSFRTTTYVVPATDGTAIYEGDFVQIVREMSAAANGEYYPVCAQAANTGTLLGFVTSIHPDHRDSTIYRAVSTLRTIEVCDDPNAIFEIQIKGTFASTQCNLNANIDVGTGSIYTGKSGMTLDGATANTTNTLQLKILRISSAVNNSIGAYTTLVCMINNHLFRAGTTAI